ncbi:hypothetical protein Tco_0994854 [Tanacetum coccineum]
MLAPSNYVQWKSRIKRYIDTKPNNELIHYCLKNPPYKFKWTEKTIPVAEGSSETTTEGYIENYMNVSQDIRDQLNAKAEVVQIILTGIDNDIYSIVDACLNTSATRNRGKAIINSPPPTYDQEPTMVAENDEISKDKEIDKLKALISLLFKKIYKPTNNNLKTSSNTSRENQDNTPRINKGTGYDNNQRAVNVAGARENVAVAKGQNDNDNYNVFSNDREHPKQPESVNATYLEEQGDTNITIDSLDIKNHNKFLESSNKALVDRLKGETEDFKTKNKSLESSNNHFKEANNELSKTNQLMFKDFKKFQAELDRYHDVNYASKVAIDCAKAKGDLMS